VQNKTQKGLKAVQATAREALTSSHLPMHAWTALTNSLRCGEDWHLYYSADGAPKAVPYTCGRKFCPSCLSRWSDALKARLLPVAQKQPPTALRHLVLTVPNARSSELPAAQSQLYKSWRQWRCDGRRKKSGHYWQPAGMAWKYEVHWTPETGWHPHIHAIIHVPHGLDLARGSKGREAWHRITARYGRTAALGPGIHITAPGSSAAVAEEVAKYAAKPIPLGHLPPSQLAELAGALHGVRFTGSSGTLACPAARSGDSGWTYIGTAGALMASTNMTVAADAIEHLVAAVPYRALSRRWKAMLAPLYPIESEKDEP